MQRLKHFVFVIFLLLIAPSISLALSVEEIVKLKEAGVGDDVIKTMIESENDSSKKNQFKEGFYT